MARRGYFSAVSLDSEEDMRRFFAYVTHSETGCWNWRGATAGDATACYGRVPLFTGEKIVRAPAHRVAYQFINGPILQSDIVRHSCDNPLCINPDHLSVGTHVDNVGDRVQRSRSAKGGDNGRSRMADGGVRLARHLVANGTYSIFHLAKIMRVDYKSAWKAVRGETYAHLEEQVPGEAPGQPMSMCFEPKTE